jgi:hypothetical protein
MLRLLLPKEKTQLRHEYMRRFAVLFLGVVTIVCLAWGFSLVPTYVLLQAEERVLKESVRVATDPALSADRKELKAELQALSRKLKLLDVPAYQVSRILQAVTDSQTRAITIASIGFDTVQNPETKSVDGALVLSGTASSRNGLLSFVEALKSNTDVIAEADVPLSSLIKDADIPFTVTVALVPVALETE